VWRYRAAMGLLDRLRRATAPRGPIIGPTSSDVEMVRRALRGETQRRGKSTGLSMTQLLEHSTESLRHVDLYAVIAHLEAEGELTNLQQPSDGNMRFDVTPKIGGAISSSSKE